MQDIYTQGKPFMKRVQGRGSGVAGIRDIRRIRIKKKLDQDPEFLLGLNPDTDLV